ncbi:MAG: SIR2 family protein [Rhodospirillales bacterium]
MTWRDHREFLRVLNREREAILHLHGYWRQPCSVILGRRSYASILATSELQDIFKGIWLHWSWLYIGCGNGLDDPNVGAALGSWRVRGLRAQTHFLAQAAVADALAARPDKPANLMPVGYADHAELPDWLRALTPRRRPQPFVELGPEATLSACRQPLPKIVRCRVWRELLDDEVPALAADAAVAIALRTHGWAFVYDVASVGKTTLALRLAAGAEYRDRPAFYLDLARIDDSDEDEIATIRMPPYADWPTPRACLSSTTHSGNRSSPARPGIGGLPARAASHLLLLAAYPAHRRRCRRRCPGGDRGIYRQSANHGAPGGG